MYCVVDYSVVYWPILYSKMLCSVGGYFIKLSR